MFLLFEYAVCVMPVQAMKNVEMLEEVEGEINLVATVPPCGGVRQLFVHSLKPDSNVYTEISNFIFTSDQYSSTQLKSKFIDLAIKNPRRVLELFEGEENFSRFLNPLLSLASPHFLGSVAFCLDVKSPADEERNRTDALLRKNLKGALEGNAKSEAEVIHILEQINPRRLAILLMEKYKGAGYEVSQKDIPMLVDMFFGSIHTDTYVCLDSRNDRNGTDGYFVITLKNETCHQEIPLHFRHTESAVIYILLLIARIKSKDMDLRTLLEKNKETFTGILKSVYDPSPDKLNGHYEKLLFKKLDGNRISKSEGKLKLCKSDINKIIHTALKDIDCPYPFEIDNSGRLLVPRSNIVLPDVFMKYPIL